MFRISSTITLKLTYISLNITQCDTNRALTCFSEPEAGDDELLIAEVLSELSERQTDGKDGSWKQIYTGDGTKRCNIHLQRCGNVGERKSCDPQVSDNISRQNYNFFL